MCWTLPANVFPPGIKDDFLDCFGDPAVTGKIGTDIEDNKCSWLVVQALARVTPQQKAELEVCELSVCVAGPNGIQCTNVVEY